MLLFLDKEYLAQLIVMITFLATELIVMLHSQKLDLQHYSKGIPFIGAVIKPPRMTTGRRTNGSFMKPAQSITL